jgi:hypothetical protein
MIWFVKFFSRPGNVPAFSLNSRKLFDDNREEKLCQQPGKNVQIKREKKGRQGGGDT